MEAAVGGLEEAMAEASVVVSWMANQRWSRLLFHFFGSSSQR